MAGVIVRQAGGKGKGTFADRDFTEGELILRNDITRLRRYSVREMEELIAQGKMRKEDCEHCDYIGHGRYVLDFSPLSYVNHSCEPNTWCEFRRLGKQELIALRQIRRGEELTYDYSLQAVDSIDGRNPWTMRCRCGSRTCRKLIQGDFFRLSRRIQKEKVLILPTWLRRKYRGRIQVLTRVAVSR